MKSIFDKNFGDLFSTIFGGLFDDIDSFTIPAGTEVNLVMSDYTVKKAVTKKAQSHSFEDITRVAECTGCGRPAYVIKAKKSTKIGGAAAVLEVQVHASSLQARNSRAN